MKEWHIQKQNEKRSLLVDHITTLKGSIKDWKEIIYSFQSYFSHKQTPYSFYENKTLLPRNDFSTFILSFSKHFKTSDLNKELKTLKQQFISQLQLSPFYKQLITSWEELVEEVEFLNESSSTLNEYQLNPFSRNIVQSQLSMKEKSKISLQNLDSLLASINMLEKLFTQSKKIIFIIHPEKKLSKEELINLYSFLCSKESHIQFFIISENDFSSNLNISYNDKIINQLTCKQHMNELEYILPVVFNEQVYLKNEYHFLKTVDNFRHKTVILSYEAVDNFEDFLYLYGLFLLTNIPVIIDYSTIPDKHRLYIDKLTNDAL